MHRRVVLSAPVVVAVFLCVPASLASFHTWDIAEVFSSADGSVQYVEMVEAAGFNNQHLFAGRHLTTASNDFAFPSNLPSSLTANKRMLLATAGFAALAGAPTPDYIIPAGFFKLSGDTISLRSTSTGSPVDSMTYGAGNLPLNCVDSLNRNLSTGTNSPTNYAGATGSVNCAAAPPPVVPDGSAGTPMRVAKLDASGTQLRITFDDATCSDASDHVLLYGGGSVLPASFAGIYNLDGSQCSIGTTSPYDWASAPDPVFDSTGFIWWILVATDGSTTEGSWGRNSGSLERTGPAGGASGQCGVTTKDVSNSCGQ